MPPDTCSKHSFSTAVLLYIIEQSVSEGLSWTVSNPVDWGIFSMEISETLKVFFVPQGTI